MDKYLGKYHYTEQDRLQNYPIGEKKGKILEK